VDSTAAERPFCQYDCHSYGWLNSSHVSCLYRRDACAVHRRFEQHSTDTARISYRLPGNDAGVVAACRDTDNTPPSYLNSSYLCRSAAVAATRGIPRAYALYCLAAAGNAYAAPIPFFALLRILVPLC